MAADSPSLWWYMRAHPGQFLISAWPWRSLLYVSSGALTGLAYMVVFGTLLAVGSLFAAVVVGLAVLAGAVLLSIRVAAWERARLRVVRPARPLTDPHAPVSGPGARVWARERLRESATWRELGFVVVSSTFGLVLNFAVLIVFAFVVGVFTAPLQMVVFWSDTVMMVWWTVDGLVPALLSSLAGLLLMIASAYLLGWAAGMQEAVALLLLAPRTESGAQVHELTRSRIRLVDAFDAERRRIERDLHDGAQQRLMAITLKLGMAEMRLAQGTDGARDLIAQASQDARETVVELRELIRGIHPQVLVDRGIGAAADELAVTCPLPVRVTIDLPRRLPLPVETAAYFTLSELVANAVKHSRASLVEVEGSMSGDRLLLVVRDDGVGGAEPAGGTGLLGLADRVAVVEGSLTVSSPRGGPTTIHVEIPCPPSSA